MDPPPSALSDPQMPEIALIVHVQRRLSSTWQSDQSKLQTMKVMFVKTRAMHVTSIAAGLGPIQGCVPLSTQGLCEFNVPSQL